MSWINDLAQKLQELQNATDDALISIEGSTAKASEAQKAKMAAVKAKLADADAAVKDLSDSL